MWLYHSHVDEVKDIHTGLIGPIIITSNKVKRDYELMPKDVTTEYSTFFVLYDENESWLFQRNVDRYIPEYSDFDDPDFQESNLMHSINGYLFGMEGLNCGKGDTVRWYTASFGNEKDGPHSPHWHGNIAVTTYGENTDTVVIIPGTTSTVTMDVDNVGKWLYHCHVFDHIEAGMITTYTVSDKRSSYGSYFDRYASLNNDDDGTKSSSDDRQSYLDRYGYNDGDDDVKGDSSGSGYYAQAVPMVSDVHHVHATNNYPLYTLCLLVFIAVFNISVMLFVKPSKIARFAVKKKVEF
jgi:plastocyanin